MLPRHALPSIMVWNAGVGPWWAATAEIFKNYQALVSPSKHRLTPLSNEGADLNLSVGTL